MKPFLFASLNAFAEEPADHAPAEPAVNAVADPTAHTVAETAADSVGGKIAQEDASMFYLDVGVFCAFVLLVVFVGIFMGRRSKGASESESYFLAGRGLGWWLIGFSLIAANISTEQFVGMSGQAAMYLGLAIASYEWLAAVTLVIVAFFFLPQFLKTGIYTIPEFLEKRYNKFSRTLTSLSMVIILVAVSFAMVVNSGALTFKVLFKDVNIGVPLNMVTLSFAIGTIAMLYVACGGLKACAWADLIQGSALIISGGCLLYFAMLQLGITENPVENLTIPVAMSTEQVEELHANLNKTEPNLQGGWERFQMLNKDKLRMNLPWNDPLVPVTALFFGLWIPNLYYWGLNQYIVQRTLGAQSLSQGQKGIVFAAFMKLLIPFIVVFPGMIAMNLYSKNLQTEAMHEEDNGKTIAVYETVKDTPQDSLKIFDFREDYFKLYPQDAEAIFNYNKEVFKSSTSEDFTSEKESVLDQQQELLKEVKSINQVRSRESWMKYFGALKEGEELEKPFAIETQLIGYKYDSAFSILVKELIPPGLRGFMLAAILGAVISSLASILNAASTITTMDLYKEYISPNSSEKTQVFVGRICVVVFMIFGCLVGLGLNDPAFKGLFTYVQEFQGFISPGILSAFIFGFFARYAPSCCGPTALLGSPIIYGLLMKFASHIPFLDRMAITFVSVSLLLALLTAFFPRKEPFVPQGDTTMDLRPSRSAKVIGVLVILITLGLYLYFWQYDWTAFNNFFTNLFFRFLS